MQSLVWNLEFLNFEPKMSYLGVLGRNSTKDIVIFENSALKFAWLQRLV